MGPWLAVCRPEWEDTEDFVKRYPSSPPTATTPAPHPDPFMRQADLSRCSSDLDEVPVRALGAPVGEASSCASQDALCV